MRIGVDARILGDAKGPFRLGAGAQLYVPSANEDQAEYVTDGTVRAMGRVLFAGDVGALTYAGQFGVHVRPRDDSPTPGSPQGTELLFGAAAGAKVAIFGRESTALVVGPEVYGASAFRSLFSTNATALEGLLTTRVEGTADDGPQVRVKLGVGGGIDARFGAPEWRVVFGIELFDHHTDRDGDGVSDSKDACPDTPGIKTEESEDQRVSRAPERHERAAPVASRYSRRGSARRGDLLQEGRRAHGGEAGGRCARRLAGTVERELEEDGPEHLVEGHGRHGERPERAAECRELARDDDREAERQSGLRHETRPRPPAKHGRALREGARRARREPGHERPRARQHEGDGPEMRSSGRSRCAPAVAKKTTYTMLPVWSIAATNRLPCRDMLRTTMPATMKVSSGSNRR